MVRSDEIRAAGTDLVKVYTSATGEMHALRGVNVSFRAGSLAVVMGPSGSGKSSLLNLLAARDVPSAGSLRLLGREVSALGRGGLGRLRRHISYVPQRASRALFPHLSAGAQIRQLARLRRVREVDPYAVLSRVGLEHRASSRPADASGGEQQRLAVALALVGTPSLVVADEPTSELDHRSGDQALAVLSEAAAAGSAVVVSTHDERVLAVADRVLQLRHGVLSGEREGRGQALAAIDPTGRVQLPPEALERFPTGRALLTIEDDAVVLRPPGDAG